MKKDQSFWQKLKKPIYALAPMAGITDSAFRQICKEFGSHITYSEMASVAALVHSPKKH
ncbi:tRNA-dihydrouridine synthase [Patescibacteria group bacterium]|nr:tRNA-dihydrouridine synthase [Patescibacteria group bacterium]MBU1421125.1 tRNA-dihydrouridine synthase [Patescibacteria group bacterium]MBU2415826.1 tRNA-dihydrouridine synthase [Patescibacteria group bacterium]MBU2456843.1 tRNA-dihydrouridine synthase [Patescibacteria group bacterium]